MKKDGKDPLMWEEVHTEHLIEDEWIDFRSTSWKFPDGNVYGPFYSYSRRNYVVVVASDTDGNYLCVKQFRQGIRQITTEFPAGAIEGEDAFAAARRELLEETGYESDEWKHLLTVPSDATISDNEAYLFLAKNCRKVSEQNLDETEFMNVLKLSAEEIEKRMKEGQFQQAIHITAWLLALREKGN